MSKRRRAQVGSDFATRLRFFVKAQGVTPAETARILGVAPSTVSRWLRGLRTPSGLQQASVLRKLRISNSKGSRHGQGLSAVLGDLNNGVGAFSGEVYASLNAVAAYAEWMIQQHAASENWQIATRIESCYLTKEVRAVLRAEALHEKKSWRFLFYVYHSRVHVKVRVDVKEVKFSEVSAPLSEAFLIKFFKDKMQ